MVGISSFINRVNFVKQIPIFKNLNWFDIQKISRKSAICEYKKGDVIIKEGTPPDFFYCLISGRLQAYTSNTQGKKENIEFIHRGMHFGIISVLTGDNHSINFETMNDSVVLKIRKEDFEDILRTIPQLGIEFSQSLSKRVRGKSKGTKRIFESTIISVYSPVVGTGSSTYAMNLALSLQHETRKKVVFVNLHSKEKDSGAPQVSVQQASPQWKIPAVDMAELTQDYERLSDCIVKGDLQIDLLNVCFDPKDAEVKGNISHFVSSLVGDYHYVVVDLPNNMNEVVLETLTQSDLVHLITADRKKDLKQIRDVIDKLEVSLKENFREEKIKIIIRAVHDKVYLSFEQINQFIDYHVYTMLPLIHRDQLRIPVDALNISFLRCHGQSEYSKQIKRIAREIGGVLVGVALGGGAALGLAHIGVIRLLEKHNIPVDVVVGSSMGALVGALWTTGKNADELEVIAREFEKKTNMIKLCDPVFPIYGIVGGRFIKRWLKRHLGDKTFYGAKIPFKAVAYDIIRREEIVIDGGSLVDAVRQSIAIPGVIEPIKKGDQVIIDGGVLNPLPTNVLAQLGIKKIIAVNVLQSPEDCSEGFDIEKQQDQEKRSIPFWKAPHHYIAFRLGKVLSALFVTKIPDIIIRTLQASEYELSMQSAQQADVLIQPDLVGIKWDELSRVDDLVEAGQKATEEKLDEIKKLIED